eukprot:1159770-Pelagomonas_calceolata.AAC.2
MTGMTSNHIPIICAQECITLDSGEIIITHTANNMEQYNNVVEYSSSKPSPARSSFMKAATRVN